MNHTEVQPARVAATWHDYLELTKPRVVALIVLTSLVGSLIGRSGTAAARYAAVREPRRLRSPPPAPPSSTMFWIAASMRA